MMNAEVIKKATTAKGYFIDGGPDVCMKIQRK
jgi:hypothetical protein